jgi:hypothetical protein
MEERSMFIASLRRRGAPSSVLALSLLIAGCTGEAVKSMNVEMPRQAYTLALGDVTATDSAWQDLVAYFRLGFMQRLQELNGSHPVVDTVSAPVPPDAAVVSGQIIQATEGSEALRWVIGMGAGSARASGVFEIRDAAGNRLAQFKTSSRYSGGLGFGGLGEADVNAMMSKMGVKAAEAAWHWSKGQPMEDDNPGSRSAQ